MRMTHPGYMFFILCHTVTATAQQGQDIQIGID